MRATPRKHCDRTGIHLVTGLFLTIWLRADLVLGFLTMSVPSKKRKWGREFGIARFLTVLSVSVLTVVLSERRIVSAQNATSFAQTSLVIETQSGLHRFKMEMAQEPAQLVRGLMGRRSLAADAGMLFIYPRSHLVAMWMKDTLLPLDILFVRSDGVIDSVVERTTPLSLASIRSKGDVQGVVEVNAGTVKRLQIKAGDRVIHEVFGNAD